MNNLRMDWALENIGLLPPQSGRTRSPETSLRSLSSADRCGRLHRLCKLLQATCNSLQSVAGPLVPGRGPIAVVELPAGTTRKALADLATAAVREALLESGLLQSTAAELARAAPARSRGSIQRGGRRVSAPSSLARPRRRCARRRDDRVAALATGKLSAG